MPIAITLHVLAAAIWVGGMFFAYMALRPAAARLLDPPQRLPLWSHTLRRFFLWVWIAIVILPASGYWMILLVFGGFANVGAHVHIMQTIGIIMIMIFFHVFFAPYRRMNQAIAAGDYPKAGEELGRIRRYVGINLLLGLLTIAVASGGGYYS
jgi:uncharacterized membrane protein